MKRYHTAVRSLIRKACTRPTPAPDLPPKFDATLQLLDEVKSLILERQAALRKTVAAVAVALMLSATPAWSEEPPISVRDFLEACSAVLYPQGEIPPQCLTRIDEAYTAMPKDFASYVCLPTSFSRKTILWHFVTDTLFVSLKAPRQLDFDSRGSIQFALGVYFPCQLP